MTTETTDMLRPLMTDEDIDSINETRTLLTGVARKASERVVAAGLDTDEDRDELAQNRATIVEEYAKLAEEALAVFLIRARIYGHVDITHWQLSNRDPDVDLRDPDVEPDYGAAREPDGMTEHDSRL